MKVSVCIPMYNNASTVARCLSSVVDQKGIDDFEIVVVDDASTDASYAIAASLLRESDTLVRNVERLGISGNHNRCIDFASGELVQFVHADDQLLPDALRELSKCFSSEPIGLAFAPRYVNTKNSLWDENYSDLHRNFHALSGCVEGSSLVTQMVRRGVPGNWIGEPTSVMFRRSLALKVGGFRQDIYQLLDLDLWIRIILHSKVCFVSEPLAIRFHSQSTESMRNYSTRKDWLDRLRLLAWIVVDTAAPVRLRVLAAAWWGPVWFRLCLRTIVKGPDRARRTIVLACAPVREFITAKKFSSRLQTREV